MKRSTLALTVIVAALVLALVTVLFIEQLNDSSSNSPDQNDLFIASFDPILLGSDVTAGNIVLANPTSSYFDNLTLTAKVDDSRLIEPALRLWLPPNNNVSIPVTRISWSLIKTQLFISTLQTQKYQHSALIHSAFIFRKTRSAT